ncbi:MAG TPA: hypothetical protein VMH27_18125 [Puia sp.]|nr:hypothetical protein [Puia sp.]
MKNILFLSFFFLGQGQLGVDPDFINPTGTYLLKGEVKNSKIIGHYGELRVRLMDTNRVALSYYVNKGYPGYESGSFIDTLYYEDNRAIYKPINDSSCAIYFVFQDRSVEISQEVADLHSGCGFGPGVMIPAILEKTSSEIPVIQDMSPHGRL